MAFFFIALFPVLLQAQTRIPFDPLKILPKTGQTPPADSARRVIEIRNSDELEQETDTIQNVVKRKLRGQVRLFHEGAVMTCDSAILYPDGNYLEAHSRVKIVKGDSVEVQSELLKYYGDSKLAYLERNVRLKDKNSLLIAPLMTYEVNNDIGHFYDGGTLTSDSTVLTSQQGTYFQKKGYAIFRENVVLTSPDYTMYADSMKYHTESKIAYFITTTTIISDEDTIVTSSGYFDTQKNKAVLENRPLIKKGKDNTLRSDFLDYDKEKGIGIARGNVISRNTEENATLLANDMYYADSNQYVRATQDPLMIQEDDKDTLYLSADTLINFAVARESFLSQLSMSDADTSMIDSLMPVDSLVLTDSLTTDRLHSTDTSPAYVTDSLPGDSIPSVIFQGSEDSVKDISLTIKELRNYSLSIDISRDSMLSLPKILSDSSDIVTDSLTQTEKTDSIKVFYGHRDVKLIRTNMSGICDSIYFNSLDSIFRLFYDPILWMDSTQLTADTIFIFMKDKKAERIELMHNAMIISESDSGVYNQISGRKITGWLHDNKLKHVLVDGNAECIYFLKNDSSEYIGGNQSKSALINISFNDKDEIEKIRLEITPEALFTPIQKIDFISYRLGGFSWHWSLRPKTKWDVIRDTLQYQNFLLEHPLPADSTLSPDSLSTDSLNIALPLQDTLQPEEVTNDDATVPAETPDLPDQAPADTPKAPKGKRNSRNKKELD